MQGHEVPDVLSDECAVLIHGQPEDLSILGSPHISEVGQRDHVAPVPSQPARDVRMVMLVEKQPQSVASAPSRRQAASARSASSSLASIQSSISATCSA